MLLKVQLIRLIRFPVFLSMNLRYTCFWEKIFDEKFFGNYHPRKTYRIKRKKSPCNNADINGKIIQHGTR